MLIKDADRALLSGVPEAHTLRGRCTTYRSLFTKQYRGVRVNDILSDLHVPALRHLSDDVLKAAKLFTRDMIKQGFEPMQPPEGLVMWGPYPPRNMDVMRSGGKRAGGRMEDEWGDDESADFVVQGVFIAPRGHMLMRSGGD